VKAEMDRVPPALRVGGFYRLRSGLITTN
jgi:hypothetical protein